MYFVLQVEVYAETVEEWTGPSQPADVISFMHVMGHITDPKAVIQRCMTWLRPGGTLAITQMSKDSPLYKFCE